ncbi:YqhR family membrane protein [Neobacillus terrae]|uniref:YqhR family membrane protein n=1 Tax=Neobacillus terrae TaxID=3034837 RepID=UPI001407BEF2|nr:YqhR family membrane protein [Neobacillus terrae]NHM32222.1 hypothetical protein [Neobacillus terrae]
MDEEKVKDRQMAMIAYVVYTGLFAGIFWSSIGCLAYFFNFTDIRPNVILDPWAIGDWKTGWLGTVISIILMGVFSIIAALIYYAVLKNIRNRWIGIIYGLVLFFLVFLVLNPIFPEIKPFKEIERNTIITSACLYVVYGVFIGYSISYEQQNRKRTVQRHTNEHSQ